MKDLPPLEAQGSAARTLQQFSAATPAIPTTVVPTGTAVPGAAREGSPLTHAYIAETAAAMQVISSSEAQQWVRRDPEHSERECSKPTLHGNLDLCAERNAKKSTACQCNTKVPEG